MANKLCRKLRKYKERHNKKVYSKDLKNKQAYSNSNEENNFLINDFLKDSKSAILPEPCIKNKYFEMRPTSVEEARKQLDLIDHDFYVFRNRKNNELQVIYKRHHGGYGLIQSK